MPEAACPCPLAAAEAGEEAGPRHHGGCRGRGARWYLYTHWFTPWFDTEAAAAYLRREPGTLKGWRSRGEGPRFYVVNGQLVRYHVDDLDAFVRGGRRKKRVPAWLMDKVAERAADRLLPAVKPPGEGDEK